ncbi:MAG: hypothetical protein ACOVMP_03805 [Chthoniobacterales bacterium]
MTTALQKMNFTDGTKIYATPSKHLSITYYTGLPAQSVAHGPPPAARHPRFSPQTRREHGSQTLASATRQLCLNRGWYSKQPAIATTATNTAI